jgi:Domain of unknown function (DUF6531)
VSDRFADLADDAGLADDADLADGFRDRFTPRPRAADGDRISGFASVPDSASVSGSASVSDRACWSWDGAGDPTLLARSPADIPQAAGPVDVATGDVLLFQDDVSLPGVLPLVIGRAHRSSWRAGRWFGPSWASTFDQRLQVAPDQVIGVFADGRVLSWPCRPAPGLIRRCPAVGHRRALLRHRRGPGGHARRADRRGRDRGRAPAAHPVGRHPVASRRRGHAAAVPRPVPRPETGLHYNQQRYYDPVTSSYLTPDPLGLAPAPNPHAYVPNPLIQIDPLGLMSCSPQDVGFPDKTLVVRGGVNTPERFAYASGATFDEAGKVYNVSVNSAPGRPIEDLAEGIPNKQVGVADAGSIRAAGGWIQAASGRGNPYHCLAWRLYPRAVQ